MSTESPQELLDLHWMERAIEQARAAEQNGDVPVGCVIALGDDVIGTGHNKRELAQDPTGHAEIYAIRQAAEKVGSWRLIGATAYVTLEPCAMCAGALVLARVSRVVYGCDDPKAGMVRSKDTIGVDARLNHKFELTTGVRGEECSKLLSNFFAAIRAGQKLPKST